MGAGSFLIPCARRLSISILMTAYRAIVNRAVLKCNMSSSRTGNLVYVGFLRVSIVIWKPEARIDFCNCFPEAFS